MTSLRVYWPIAIVALTASCYVPKSVGVKMQADIRDLQESLRTAEKGLDEQRSRLAEQMQRAEDQISDVERALNDLQRAAHKTDADLGVEMEQLVREVQELRGSIELAEYRLQKLEAPKPEPEPSPAKKPSEPLPEDKKGLLAHARKLVSKGDADNAKGVYRSIVKKWPSSQGTTDEAYFRLGDIYYQSGRCSAAVGEFVKVVEKFPKGSYADDAYFRIGMCSQKMGNLEDAEVFFGQIVKYHRKSALYANAQQKLKEVRKQLSKEKAAKSKKKKKK